MARTEAQIKLYAAGITQRQIHRKSNFSEFSVCQTMRGRRHNQTIQETAAEMLGVPAAELWGENYAPVWRQNKKQKSSSEFSQPASAD